jgi:YfiH family protein
MITPVPDGAFEWRDTAWGTALVCTALEPFARHLFTTRPWALGLTRDAGSAAWGDVAAALDRPYGALVRLKQVHGHDTVFADDVPNETIPPGDIVMGRDAARVLAVQAADCVPMLIADRRTGAVAAAHAGWRGLAEKVPQLTVEQICARFGCDPADLLVACGPSIGACCYEVGPELRDGFVEAGSDSGCADAWFSRTAASSPSNPAMPGIRGDGRPGHWFFDGWQCVRDQLVSAGVRPADVFVARLCTASHPHLLCSYRRDGPTAGRIAGAIVPGR